MLQFSCRFETHSVYECQCTRFIQFSCSIKSSKKNRQLGYNDTGIGLLGTGRYSQTLDSIVIGDIFRSDTQYDTDRKICREVRYFSDASEQI